MRIMSSQWFAAVTAQNTDLALAALDVPHDGILNGFGGEVSVQADAESVVKAHAYDLGGFIVPSPNPEDSTTYDDLLHDYVDKAKDASATGIRLDEDPSATTPIWEPGEVRWGDLMDVAILDDEKMFYKYRGLMTFPKRPVGWVDGSPDTYIPTDFVNIRSMAGRRRVSIPSHAILACSAPSMDDSSTTLVVPAENTREWMWLRNAQQMLEFAYSYMLAMTDGSGDDPWELATLYLEELIAPPIRQPTAAGTYFTTTRNVIAVGKGTFDISVPGRDAITQISGGN